MRIDRVALVVADVDVSASYYEQLLELPVDRSGERAEVTIGTTTLELTGDPAHTGTHHLAITIPSNKFDAAKEWIQARTDLLTLDGADEFETAPHWNAHSLYFIGADGTILELIIRRELDNATSGPFGSADLLYVSEVGIAVDDVPSTLKELTEAGVLPYGWNAPDFAPVGDVEGLLILVGPGRPWFPTPHPAGVSPISVDARSQADAEVALAPASRLRLGPSASVATL